MTTTIQKYVLILPSRSIRCLKKIRKENLTVNVVVQTSTKKAARKGSVAFTKSTSDIEVFSSRRDGLCAKALTIKILSQPLNTRPVAALKQTTPMPRI